MHQREELRLMGRDTREADFAPHKKVLLDTSSQDRAGPSLRVDRQERMVVCWDWGRPHFYFSRKIDMLQKDF